MDALAFYGLVATDDPLRWRLPVVSELCSSLGALFGGCGLGASIEAMERSTGRQIVWATAQYLSFARPPAIVDLVVTEIVRGRYSSQARTVARVDGEEIFTVTAALGKRAAPWSGSWAERPRVPEPDDCPPRPEAAWLRDTINDRLDIRLANARSHEELTGVPGDGRSSLWVRVNDLDLSASALAIVGDYVPFGISQALGEHAGGNSLDNTLRVAHRVPPSDNARESRWILADVRVHAVADGFGHGLVHLWTEDGTLLGTASQSTIVRRWQEEHAAVLRSAEQTIEGRH